MKDIKFRAWDSGSKVMAQWEFCENHAVKNDIGFRFIAENGFTYPWEHPDLVKMQYTGLKDKNGKEIYEGDVLQAEYTTTLKVAVWSEKRGAFIGQNGFNELLCNDLHLYKVIGNIHDNPELLPF